jgi:hypothetical protein
MSLPPYDQSIRELERQYQVVLPDSVGQAALGFREGVWFRVNAGAPRPVPIRSAIILCPHAAGSIVQIACWWMRENARTPRALDLATELALCVGELARKAVEDDPLGMSLDSLSSSQQSAMTGFAGVPPQGQGYGAAGGGLGTTGGFESGYGTGGYQAPTDPYAAPAYPAPVSAAATTVLPQIPADGGGYGAPQAPRGPAIPPRGAGAPGGPAMPLGSGGYPQRPAPQPLNGQPMRPQQPGARYPQGQGPGPGGRPPQQRPMPRPERYEDDFRGDVGGRPQPRPQGRPEPGSAW